jgi:hypothetical protein
LQPLLCTKGPIKSIHEEKICITTKDNLQKHINAVCIKESTQALKIHFEVHVALIHEEEKPSICSKYNHRFLTEDFARPIGVVHEGGKLCYNTFLATNYLYIILKIVMINK